MLSIALNIIALPFEICSLSYQYLLSKPKIFKSILITGASSGIGLEFALKMASNPNTKRLVLIARNLNKLKQAKTRCIDNGCANVRIYSCDVTKREKMRQIIEECDNECGIDFVFANAGYRSNLCDNLIVSAYRTFDINIYGALNTILPIIPRMKERKNGQIVINASIAGLTPQKLFPFYSTSKHALLSLAENLRSTLAENGIGITVTLPGFVETELVTHLDESKLPMIGKMKTLNAVQQIEYAATYNVAIAGFPFIATLLAYLYESVSCRFKQIILDFNVIDRNMVSLLAHKIPCFVLL